MTRSVRSLRLRGAAVRAASGALLLLMLLPRLWFAVEGRHFWDENFSLRNTAYLLSSGGLEPHHDNYALVSYLPHAAAVAVLDRLTDRPLGAPDPVAGPLDLSGEGRLACRLVQAVLSFALVVAAGWVARRWFGAWAGVTAVVAVGMAPDVIRDCGYFKPDALLALASLLAVYAAVEAAVRGGAGRAAVAGGLVGLTLSAKLSGVAVVAVVPLALLVVPGRRMARLRSLSVAGAAALAVYWALNPYWRENVRFARGVLRHYARKARRVGPDEPAGLEAFGDYLAGLHGSIFLALVLAGGVLLVAAAWRRREPAARARAVALIGFPILFTGFYFGRTSYFKENNLLPVVPVLTLWACAAIAMLTATARGKGGRRWAAATAIVTVGVLVSWSVAGGRFLYRRLVPTTWDLARSVAGRELGRPRHLVLSEREERSFPPWQGRRSVKETWLESSRLTDFPGDALDGADWEVFRESGLDGPGGEILRRRLAAVRSRHVSRLVPRPFRVRGPSLVVLRHPWEVVQPRGSVGTGTALRRSAVVWLPSAYLSRHRRPRLRVGERSLVLNQISRLDRGWIFTTARSAASLWTTEPVVEPPSGGAVLEVRTWEPQSRYWRHDAVPGAGRQAPRGAALRRQAAGRER